MKKKQVLSILLATSMLTNTSTVFATEDVTAEDSAVQIINEDSVGEEVTAADEISVAEATEATVTENATAETTPEETAGITDEASDESVETENTTEVTEESEAADDLVISEEALTTLADDTFHYSGDKRDVSYVSYDVDLDIAGLDNEKYHIVMTALPEDIADKVIDFISANYKEDSEVSMELTAENFLDAEKWSLNDDLDSELCWAASASNMLWNSGWATSAINPMTGEPFYSEDEIFTYFTYRMTNGPGFATSGIEWFFDALYDCQYDDDGGAILDESTAESSSNLPFLDDQDGLLRDILVSNMLAFNSVNGDLSAIEILKDLAYDAEDSKSICVNIGFFGDSGRVGSHAVTAIGVIFDKLAESIENMYKAIILADSDTDATGDPDAGYNFDEKMIDKTYRVNRYSIYNLRPYQMNGYSYWELLGYSDPAIATLITAFESLSNYTPELQEENTEAEGSTDVRNDYDLSLNKVTISKDSLSSGENMEISLNVSNRLYYDLTEEIIPTIPLSYTIMKDGEAFSSGTTDLNYLKLLALSKNPKNLTINLSTITDLKLPAGTYTIEFMLNPLSGDDSLKEAYYQNNTQTVTFTVTSSQEDVPEDDPADTPTDDPTEETPTDIATETTEESSYVSVPISLIHSVSVENDGDWDLTKLDENGCFTVKVYHPASEFLALYEIKESAGDSAESENGTEKIEVAKENYRIVDQNDSFVVEFDKDYLNTLDAGKHTFAIELMSLAKDLTFDIMLTK